MADAQAVFARGGNARQEGLKTFWPELYDALAGTAKPSQERAVWCVLGSCAVPTRGTARTPAAGRLTRNGHPACRSHIALLADRPGGWPLKRIEERP